MIDAAVQQGRVLAVSLMRDVGSVSRPTGRVAQDEATGFEVEVLDPLFTTPLKVSGRSTAGDVTPRTVRVGGVERVVLEGRLHLPVPAADSVAAGLREGDVVEVVTVGPMTDPDVLGARYRVVDFGGGSYATARRVNVVEL